MKKWWPILVVVLIAFFTIKAIRNQKPREAAESEKSDQNGTGQQTIVSERTAAVALLVKRTGADADWSSRLSDSSDSFYQRVFTVSYERAWRIERPILFVGVVRDIVSASDGKRLVILEASPNWMPAFNIYSNCRLSLVAPSDSVDSFLLAHKGEMQADLWEGSVAVAAQIETVEAEYSSNTNSEVFTNIVIGNGQLLDWVYVGRDELGDLNGSNQ